MLNLKIIDMKTKNEKKQEKLVQEKLLISFNQFNGRVQNDKKWFNSFGVNRDKLDYFSLKVKKFETLFQDVSFETNWREKQKIRRTLRVDLRENIRKVQVIMITAWSDSHPMSYIHKLQNIKRMNDFELANTARILLLFAHNNKQTLLTFGLQDELLYKLSVTIGELTTVHVEIEAYAKQMKIQKAMIKQSARELIIETKILARIGRMIWIERDKEHWAEYRLPHHIYRKILEPDIGIRKK